MTGATPGRKPGTKNNSQPTRQITITILEKDYSWILLNGYSPTQLMRWAVLAKQQHGDKIKVEEKIPWRP